MTDEKAYEEYLEEMRYDLYLQGEEYKKKYKKKPSNLAMINLWQNYRALWVNIYFKNWSTPNTHSD